MFLKPWQLYDEIQKSEQKYKVAVEVLSYHRAPSDEEYRRLMDRQQISEEQAKELLRYCRLLETNFNIYYTILNIIINNTHPDKKRLVL